jgi:hypothetical protein
MQAGASTATEWIGQLTPLPSCVKRKQWICHPPPTPTGCRAASAAGGTRGPSRRARSRPPAGSGQNNGQIWSNTKNKFSAVGRVKSNAGQATRPVANTGETGGSGLGKGAKDGERPPQPPRSLPSSPTPLSLAAPTSLIAHPFPFSPSLASRPAPPPAPGAPARETEGGGDRLRVELWARGRRKGVPRPFRVMCFQALLYAAF